MSLTLEQLKEKKRLLEDKRAQLKAEEKFLEGEKQRLKAKLAELGFSSLGEAKEALVKLEEELESKSSKLEELLQLLENSTVETQAVQQPQEEKVIKPITSIDDL